MVADAIKGLQNAALSAVAALRAVADDAAAPHAARVSAARTIIELSLKGHELLEIHARLETLEARITP